MMKFFGFLFFSALAAVSADPFLFNADLLKNGHDNVANVLALNHVAVGANLRFFLLVPKLGAAANFNNGFASLDANHVHGFLNVAENEALTELLGLSNCATWHATLLTAFGPNGLVHKAFAWFKDFGLATFFGWEPLVGFLHGNLLKAHFEGLVEKGLPAHGFFNLLNVLWV